MVPDGNPHLNWTINCRFCRLHSAFLLYQTADKTERIEKESKRVGLKISMEKTKVMKVNARNQERITINGLHNIEEVEEFTYLGPKICNEC